MKSKIITKLYLEQLIILNTEKNLFQFAKNQLILSAIFFPTL